MSSEIAKKVAGTFIADDQKVMAAVIEWATEQCRSGTLASHIRRFCTEQQEMLDPALLCVEQVTPECIQCRIPCRLFDHESSKTFLSEVKFRLNPSTGEASRLTEGV